MIEDIEKRNSREGIDQVMTASDSDEGGVGGRQGEAPPGLGGGGYPKNCKILNFSTITEKKRDPRLDELREMGLQRSWLEIAEAIGVDSFLTIWRILDADKTNKTDDGRRLIPMRSYSCFERYQRNRYIETLVNAGATPAEISTHLLQQIGEKISARHILRFRKRG
jgi:hypothetical protein